ncbi:glycosyltransferase family 4 protein [Actinomycetospora chlora]|uniref:Glycosyltransferase family 4 protein n=1 Tax=Actinomycetospora chlora TaxID=663608 RepID=A0ABP9B980_9PSEU
MRIGIIAPPWVPVPPVRYGGTEAVVDDLARGLHATGVDVRLFTVGTSTCPVPRAHLFDEPVAPMNASLPEAAHVLAAHDELDDVDLVHDHTLLGPLVAGRRGATHVPVVTTLHHLLTPPALRVAAEAARHASLVAISRSQARSARGVPITAVIPHGVDLDAYRPADGVGDHVVFVGRMAPEKGAHRAVRVARAAGRRLVLATKIRTNEERAYYEEVVRPLLPPDAEPPQEMDRARRVEVLGSAAALINPIRWREPFGLVMAEALACGTPVLAFPEGAAPEIVDHGRTGFLCADEEEMVAALDRLDTLDRRACRAAAERRFSSERMVDDHVALYRALLEAPRTGTAGARSARALLRGA